MDAGKRHGLEGAALQLSCQSGSGRKCPGEPGDAAGFPWWGQEEPWESEEELFDHCFADLLSQRVIRLYNLIVDVIGNESVLGVTR